MAIGMIKEDEAAQLIAILDSLHWLVTSGVLTQAQADSLKEQLNDKLHEALGLI